MPELRPTTERGAELIKKAADAAEKNRHDFPDPQPLTHNDAERLAALVRGNDQRLKQEAKEEIERLQRERTRDSHMDGYDGGVLSHLQAMGITQELVPHKHWLRRLWEKIF